MTPNIERNPDVNLDIEPIPAGFYLHEGKNLMQSARHAGIPFGVAAKRKPCSNSTRLETIGLVIRMEDNPRMFAALAKKEASKNRKTLRPYSKSSTPVIKITSATATKQ